MMEYSGLILGFSTVLSIALGRWSVIVGVYHLTRRVWILFLLLGLGALAVAAVLPIALLSSVISVLGFCFLWGIGECFEQEKRIEKGWFPRHPRHGSKTPGQ